MSDIGQTILVCPWRFGPTVINDRYRSQVLLCKPMNKLIPFFILSFLTVATSVSFSQVPVMRGLPLSPETKSFFKKGTPSDEPGNRSVWGRKEKEHFLLGS